MKPVILKNIHFLTHGVLKPLRLIIEFPLKIISTITDKSIMKCHEMV